MPAACSYSGPIFDIFSHRAANAEFFPRKNYCSNLKKSNSCIPLCEGAAFGGQASKNRAAPPKTNGLNGARE
jgi:hypothetical protein